MIIPKNVHGRDFANHLNRRWGFEELRQTGSHIILRMQEPVIYTVSVPAHKPLRPGTLRGLVNAIAAMKRVPPADIMRDL